ncbi:MAG: DUF1573 domain-containing protein [Candidatus Cloacimonetes bacterium]|nr:DUF1573 domain-containing protein [Candidatus Cloacimonadota bacterium]
MKKIFTVIMLIPCLLYLSAVPKIEFDKNTHDLGQIAEDGGPYTHDYIFTNTGEDVLQITKVKAG